MNHPFNLSLTDLEHLELDVESSLSDNEAKEVEGGLTFTTMALGEEGGDNGYPQPICPPIIEKPIIICPPRPIDPPEVTTLALGEEGGGYPICLDSFDY